MKKNSQIFSIFDSDSVQIIVDFSVIIVVGVMTILCVWHASGFLPPPIVTIILLVAIVLTLLSFTRRETAIGSLIGILIHMFAWLDIFESSFFLRIWIARLGGLIWLTSVALVIKKSYVMPLVRKWKQQKSRKI